jgi:16S rRNA (cytidine1402-2'-O)-methyltransferase
MQGKLFVVATPIGNLEDITYRAVRVLSQSDIIFCEDTRVTKILLKKYNINTKCESYHTHSTDQKENRIKTLLKEGKTLSIVSDAGTPCISDPGTKLISQIRNEIPEVKIEAIPGASALTTFLSVCGIYNDEYIFYGFMPHKKGRQTLLNKILANNSANIIYESCHRIQKLMQEIIEMESEILKTNKNYIPKKVVIGRELTKFFEEVLEGSPKEILEIFAKDKNKIKGEFVVMIV